MHTHTQTDLREQGPSDISLIIDWRMVRRPETRAGRYVISRFPVPPGHADLIAALAGLGG
jgi:hypothetical protein